MTEFLKFFLVWWNENIIIGTIAAFLMYAIFFAIVSTPFKILNRVVRSRNIKRHGWPPPHLDADGDFEKESD